MAPFVKKALKKNKDGAQRKNLYKIAEGALNRYKKYRLKKIIRYSYNNSPYYNNIFKKNNLKPGDIKSFFDLVKIPQTDGNDLQEKPEDFFATDPKNFVKVFTTSGTTGKPKKAYFTKKDIEKIVESAAMGAKLMFGITREDVVRLTFEVGYGQEIWGNRYCLDKAYGEIVGALTVSTGRLSVDEELNMIKEYHPTVFGDVTSRINFLTKAFSKKTDLKSLGIKKFLIGAEPTPKKIRENIEDSWGADAFIGYGLTEIGLLMASECEYKNGMHLNETNFFTEVVDPKTGEQLEDGEIGELVFTTFNREGMPFIRYNSHDLGRIIDDHCECGLPLKRIEIKGRSDDLKTIGSGDNVYTKMFDEKILIIPEIIDYRVVFERKNSKDILTITVESNKINDNIKNKVLESVLSMPEINNGYNNSKTIAKPIVILVKPGSFKRESIKTKRLIDKRKLYD